MRLGLAKGLKWVMAILCAFPAALFAQSLDDKQSTWLFDYVLTKYWDNVRGDPYWVSGKSIDFHFRDQANSAHLDPGESVTLRVPDDEQLLIHSAKDELTENDIEIWQSRGMGLYVLLPSCYAFKQKGLIIEPFLDSKRSPSLIRLVNKSKKCQDLVLYVSKRRFVGEIAPYRKVISLPLCPLRLRPSFEGQYQTYWNLEADNPTEVKIRGPARVAIEQWYPYPILEGTSLQTWNLDLALNGNMIKKQSFDADPTRIYSVYVDESREIVGDLQVGYIDIPPGEHCLSIKSNAKLYVRVLAQDYHDFAFHINNPCFYKPTYFEPILENLTNTINTSAWTNQFREGGLVSATLSKSIADQRIDYPEAANYADQEINKHTFYFDLLPALKLERDPQDYFGFIDPKLLEIGEQRVWVETDQRFMREYLNQWQTAYFNFVPNIFTSSRTTRTNYLMYDLPYRPSTSWIRIIADLNTENTHHYFWVQYDDEAPLKLYLKNGQELSQDNYQMTLKEVEFGMLDNDFNNTHPLVFKEPFSFPELRHMERCVSTFEICLPSHIRKVKMWTDEPAPCHAPLKIALQCKLSAPPNLSQMNYLHSLDTRKACNSSVLGEFIYLLKKPPSTSHWMDPLENDWQPLLRFLRSQTKEFYAMLDTTEIMKDRNGLLKDEEMLKKANDLKKQGENYLAINLWRILLMKSKNPRIQNEVINNFSSYYEKLNDNDGLLALYSTVMLTDPSPQVIRSLSQALVKDGKYNMALKLALLLPPCERPLVAMAQAAYQIGWWDVLESTVESMEDSKEAQYWQALLSRMMGQYDCFKDMIIGISERTPSTRRERADLVKDFEGSNLLYAVDRDLYHPEFRTKPDRPLTLQLEGPVVLRLEARPQFIKNKETNAVNDWLVITSHEKKWVTAINNSIPSVGLEVVGNQEIIPGTKTVSEIYFPEGKHDVKVGSEIPLFIEVLATQQETPLEQFTDPTSTLQSPAVELNQENIFSHLESSTLTNPQVIQRLTLLLWEIEHQSTSSGRAFAYAQAIGNKYKEMDDVQSFTNRINHQSIWQQFPTIESYAGLRYVSFEGWNPEEPKLKIIKDLADIKNNEYLITGYESIILSLINSEKSNLINIDLTKQDILPFKPYQLTVKYTVDDKDEKIVQFGRDDKSKKIALDLPEGRHAVRIQIVNPIVDQLLKIKLLEDDKDRLAEPVERPYYVATAEEPVKIRITEPMFLQINEWKNNETITEYKYAENGVLVLTPKPGNKEGLYRIFSRSLVPNKPETKPRGLVYRLDPIPKIACQPGDYQSPCAIDIINKPGLAFKGTWSPGIEYIQRVDTDDPGPQKSVQKFMQLSGTYRYFAEEYDTYFRTEILGRSLRYPSCGIIQNIDYYPFLSPWSYHAEFSGYGQKPLNRLTGKRNTEWSFTFYGYILQHRIITPKAYHEPSVGIYLRALSIKPFTFGRPNSPYSNNILDLDVFTNYKATHKRSILLKDQLVYQPWLDNKLIFDGSLYTKETLNIFKPDHVVGEVAFNQLFYELQFEANYRYAKYYRDIRRPQPFIRRSAGVGFSWQHWLSMALLEANLSYERQIDLKHNLIRLGLFLHFTGNRDSLDFQEKDLKFIPLKQQMLYEKMRGCEYE